LGNDLRLAIAVDARLDSFQVPFGPFLGHFHTMCDRADIPAGQLSSIALLKIDSVWDPIRNRPDFQQLLSGPEQIGPNK
jgi:hypothetical protein